MGCSDKKQCSKCKNWKLFEYFSKRKTSKDGHKSACKECLNSQNRVYYEQNPFKRKDYHKQYHMNNQERAKTRYLKQLQDPEKRQRRLEVSREHYKENPEYYRNHSAKWREEKRHLHNAKNAKYRATKRNATPKWLNERHNQEMIYLYEEARRLTDRTGISHHVDHIMPLTHPTSCGLHVPWNLQILTETENLRKSNKIKE